MFLLFIIFALGATLAVAKFTSLKPSALSDKERNILDNADKLIIDSEAALVDAEAIINADALESDAVEQVIAEEAHVFAEEKVAKVAKATVHGSRKKIAKKTTKKKSEAKTKK